MANNSAKIIAGGNDYWTSPKQFWRWVKEGLVELTGQHPLVGRFAGREERLLVQVKGVILSVACPEHREHVLSSYNKLAPHITHKHES